MKKETLINLAKAAASIGAIVVIAGCSSWPAKQQIPLTDPMTGELVLSLDGQPVILNQRMSQKTLQLNTDIQLIAMQMNAEQIAPSESSKMASCQDIMPPDNDSGVLYMAYAQAIGACLNGGGSGLDYRTVAAIQGKSHVPSVQMFGEQQKTVRHSNELRQRNFDRVLNVASLLTDTWYKMESLDNGGGVGSGGTFVKGDVIVSQRQSNSGGADGAAAGSEGEGEGSAAGSASGAQNRLAGMTVFGNTNGAIVTDNAKSSSTAYGPNQYLETSATGMTTQDSVNKGTLVADEQNAGNSFDDKDVSPNFDF